ncbi:TonB-dependent receptor domain-containing protein [Alkalilimnicola ehrlichii]|uniref:TonB-dependent receptor domain-containing protein n=1 Tax=Alkalilimnicola ehrlichii TaxID=351052 RepID=UPI0015F24C8E|nr:TonB-dependent receptor [Alkalilimnicola ehrlichii]
MREDGRGGETQQYAANLSGPLVKDVLGIGIQAELQKRAATPDKNNKTLSELEGREALAGSVNLSFTPSSTQRFDLRLSESKEERWRDTAAGPAVYESRDDIRRQHYSLTHRGEYGALESGLRLYQSELERTNRRSDQSASAPPQRLTDRVVDGHLSHPLGEDHLLTVGGEYRRERLRDNAFSDTGREQAAHRAVFVQDEYFIGDTMLVTAGARADRHDVYGWTLSPRLYWLHHWTDSLTFKAGYGEGFKAPTLKQLSSQFSTVGGGGRFTVVGNPDLDPETSASYEVGLAYHDTARAELTLFHTHVRDLIQTHCINNCGAGNPSELRSYTNVDRARLQGLEAAFDTPLPLGLALSLNYTYLDARDRGNNERLSHRPRHRANSRLQWQARQGITAYLRAEHVGPQVTGSGANRERLPSYNLLHTNLSLPLREPITLHFGIDNLTDLRLSDRSDAFSDEEIGRFYRASLTASF